MKSLKNISKVLAAAVLSLTLVGLSAPAEAGSGGSYSRVVSAINSGGADAIISQLEQAENLICSECPSAVMTLLDNDDYRIREAAIWWMSRRAFYKRHLSDQSMSALGSSNSREVRNAADVLGTFRHPKAVGNLTVAVGRSDVDSGARLAATRALGTIGHPAGVAGLTVAMNDADPAVRVQALTSWRLIRHQNNAAPVLTLLADVNVDVRREAAATVGQFRDAAGITGLIEALNDADPEVRRNAAWALGRIGSTTARNALLAATNDPSGKVRRHAQNALQNLSSM